MKTEMQAMDVRRLTFTLFQKPEMTKGRLGTIVAVTSPTRGEGVTHVSKLLALELSRDQSGRTLYCTTEGLARVSSDIHAIQVQQNRDSYWTLIPASPNGPNEWEFNPSTRCARLEMLRRKFDYVIIDCPAVCVTGEISGLAGFADGVVMVVGAGRSTKQQIAYALGVVEQAGGVVKGCVLNRRTYPIPSRLYRLMKG
jgi:Mrp family chromosome partitioning ATPase